jgi:hypothetical protein
LSLASIRRSAVMLGVALLGAAASATSAEAHHSILIREVRASLSEPDQGFVELQTYRQGQNNVAGVALEVYDPSGLAHQEFTMDRQVADDQSQHTILIGGSALAGVADFVFSELRTALSPGAGAVCLPEAVPPDCVSWGAFSGSSHLGVPGAGTPAAAIPEGSSLTRTTARGCPLGLDPADDSNNSAADFSLSSPTPTPNADTTSNLDCVMCGGQLATQLGTYRADALTGTPGRDVIVGGAGPDRISGLGGKDILCGGIGKDMLLAGRGRDRMIGGRGRDTCRGGAGRDSYRLCEVASRR